MRMMNIACVLAAAVVYAASPALSEEHRQLGAHVHGHGRLNIAIEGKKLSMELEAPGADIVGFEHEPSTAAQKGAIAEAKAKLANALALFGPAQQAHCELDHVKVATEAAHEDGREHEHESENEAKEAGREHEHEAEAKGHEGEAGRHSEFHAEYSLSCVSPSRLTSMTFGYFDAFSGAQQLDVSVIAPKGQSSFEVTREKPSLDLTGIM